MIKPFTLSLLTVPLLCGACASHQELTSPCIETDDSLRWNQVASQSGGDCRFTPLAVEPVPEEV